MASIIPASAVGPHNATEGPQHLPTGTPSIQHEAALITLQASVSEVVASSGAVVAHLEEHGIRGAVCPDTPVPAPAADYMRHAFPKQQDEWCNATLHPGVNTSGIDPGLGAWPRWAPLEARHYVRG